MHHRLPDEKGLRLLLKMLSRNSIPYIVNEPSSPPILANQQRSHKSKACSSNDTTNKSVSGKRCSNNFSSCKMVKRHITISDECSDKKEPLISGSTRRDPKKIKTITGDSEGSMLGGPSRTTSNKRRGFQIPASKKP